MPPLASPLLFLEPHLIGVPSSSLIGLLVGVLLPRRLDGVAGSCRRGVAGRPGEDIAKYSEKKASVYKTLTHLALKHSNISFR